MARQPKEDPTTFKYGQPLFSAVWPRGDCVFVGGGGGNTKSGIESRVVAANFTDGKLTDEIGSVRLKNTIEYLAMSPTSRLLLVATGQGITAFDVEFKDSKCSFLVPQTPVLEAFNQLAAAPIQIVRFAHDGSAIVFGDKTGRLRVWDAATFTERLSQQLTVAGEPVFSESKDVDIQPGAGPAAADAESDAQPGSSSGLVVMSCDNGGAYVWDLGSLPAAGAAAGVGKSIDAVELPKPKDLKSCAVKHCRFSRARAGELLCTMNYRGVGCVGRWTRGADGAYAYSARSKSFNSITGMDVSPDGLHIGIATADGEAFLLDAGTLGVRRAVKKAHMIFATSVAFAGDSHAFVSTSGDASARVVTLPEASSFALYIMLLLVLLCGLCAAYVLYAPSSEPPAL